MRTRPGRIYSRQGRWRRFFKGLGIFLCLLVVFFFYLYFQWKKYIVYTGDSLYLDLPFLREEVTTRNGFDLPQGENGVIPSFTAPSEEAETTDPEAQDTGTMDPEAALPGSESGEEPGEEGNVPTTEGTPDSGETLPEGTGEESAQPEPQESGASEENDTDGNGVLTSFGG